MLGNESSKEIDVMTEQETSLGRGAWVESRRVREPRRTFAVWFTVSCVTVMGLVSGLSLANHSDSRSFLVAHPLFSQDGFQGEGFWEVCRT